MYDEDDLDYDEEQEAGLVPGGMPQTGILPVVGGYAQPQRQAPRNTSMMDMLRDNWGMLGTVGVLSMLANNNGRRGIGQLLGRAGIDALGALGQAGMAGMQQDRLDAQNAATRADRALNRQIQLQNLALRMQTAQNKAAQAEQDRAFNAALNGGGMGGGYAPGTAQGATPQPGYLPSSPLMPTEDNPYPVLVQHESSGDPGDVSPDGGGSFSYGLYQLNSQPGGTAHQFLPWLAQNDPEVYAALGGGQLVPGTKAYNDAWKAVAGNQNLRGRFVADQTRFFESAYMAPAMKSLQGSGMERFFGNAGFKQMLASTIDQHGSNGGPAIFKAAWARVPKDLPEDQQLDRLITEVYGPKGRANPGQFTTKLKEDPDWMNKMRKRYAAESEQIRGYARGGQSAGQPVGQPAGRQAQGGGLGSLEAIDEQIRRVASMPFQGDAQRKALQGKLAELHRQRAALVGDAQRADSNQESIWDAAERLRKEYAGVSNPYLSLGQNLRDIMSSVKAGNGVGDIATVFQFMKALDPQSVVREGEVTMAQRTAGVPEYITNLLNKFFKGETLNAEQRRQFVQFARNSFDNAERTQRLHDERYRGLATRRGVNPEDVLYSPYGALGSEVDEWLKANPVAPSATPGAPAQGGTPVPGKPQHSIPKPSATGQSATPTPTAGSPQQSGNPAEGMSDEELQRRLGLTPKK